MTENSPSPEAEAAGKDLDDLLYAHHVIKYDPLAARRCAVNAFAKFERDIIARHRIQSEGRTGAGEALKRVGSALDDMVRHLYVLCRGSLGRDHHAVSRFSYWPSVVVGA